MQWRYRWGVVLLIIFCPVSMWAESPAAPSIELYDGAVAGQKDPLREIAKQFANPERLENVPFLRIRERLEEMLGVQVIIDEEALTEAGADLHRQRMIAEWPAGETIPQFVHRLEELESIKLGWDFDGRIARLTTRERADETYSTRQYPVAHLITRFGSAKELLDAIVEASGGLWDHDEPGTGTISLVGGVAVIRQTSLTHQRVAQILAGLEREETLILLEHSEKDLQLMRLVEEKSVNFEWDDCTLEEYRQRIEEMTNERVRLDTIGLSECGLVPEAKLSARAINLQMYDAFQNHLRNVNGTALGFLIRDDEILISSREHIEGIYETRLYRVADLGMTGDRQQHFIQMILNETEGPWDVDEPGTGTVTSIGTNGLLLIRATQRMHREIQQLIQERRQRAGLRPVIDAPRPAQTSQPVTMPAAAASASNPSASGTPSQSDGEYDVPLIVALSLLVGCGVGYGIRYWQAA